MAYQCRHDDGRTIEFASAGSLALTGYAPVELVGPEAPDFATLVHPDDRERVHDGIHDAVQAGEPWDIEYRLVSRGGGVRWVWDRGHSVLAESGEVLGLEGFVTDVTARRALEEGLLRAQKLEALGELTGSIAHDFNNLLTAIIAPVELLLDQLDPGSPVAVQLGHIQETALSAAGLTRQLLAFCRKQAPVRRIVDVNQVITLLGPTLARIVGDEARLVSTPGAGPLATRVDPSHLEQVVVNLVVNARDAQQRGGTVTLATGSLELAEGESRPLGLEPGRYVFLSVRDEGVGIPPEALPRIFEPFFTTKESGTGLGLSTVYGLVTQHGGGIEVRSSPGEGSTFLVYLPQLDAPVEDLAVRARHRGGGRTGTVLLIEDDDRVREALAEALRRHGHRVLAAKDGRGAGERVREAAGRVDVVVSDVVLEDGLGPDVVAKLRKSLPGARVIYVSGYADEEAWESIERDAEATVLQKPFPLARLLDLVAAGGTDPFPSG